MAKWQESFQKVKTNVSTQRREDSLETRLAVQADGCNLSPLKYPQSESKTWGIDNVQKACEWAALPEASITFRKLASELHYQECGWHYFQKIEISRLNQYSEHNTVVAILQAGPKHSAALTRSGNAYILRVRTHQ